MGRPGLEDKATVAVRALDRCLIAHFQEDPRMAQCPIATVTGDAGAIGFNDLRSLDRHWKVSRNARKY